MMKKERISVLVVVLFLAILHGCGDSGSPSSTGTLSLGLTDAASNDYKAVYVTISQVQVHKGADGEDGWQTISTPNKTYNLLNLVNGVMEQLSLSTLETGMYTQMRLVLGSTVQSGKNILNQNHPYANYVIDAADQYHELKVPSGYETGIKLTHEFAILEGVTTDLVMDFDVEKSIVQAGSGNSWQLKPTVKIMGTLNKAIVNGTVTAGAGVPVAGARVSAQRYDLASREVTICASTLTNESGEYQMYVEPGLYILVVYRDGYLPSCSILMAGSNEDYEQSFSIVPTPMGTVTCTVNLAQDAQDQVAEVHFLKVSPLDEGSFIEIRTRNVFQSGSYTVELPMGTYMVFAVNGAVTLPLQGIATGGQVSLDFTAQ